MKLQQLLQDLTEYRANDSSVIKGLSLNSQQIQPGELFIALSGSNSDGRAYIKDAISKGAVAVLAQCDDDADLAKTSSSSVPIIYIKNLAEKLDIIASRFYGSPALEFEEIVGVTGTNGKTTSCYLLAQALSRLAKPCAYMGTLGVGFIHSLVDSGYTTPDAISLQKYLSAFKEQGANALSMEVSSHGLMQDRVKSVPFTSAHFTNLTQDHLDYHGTMQAYGKAKQKLFEFPTLKRVVVNGDSDYSQKMLQALRLDIPIAVYTLKKECGHFPQSKKSNFFPITTKQIELDSKGISAFIQTPWGQGSLRSSLLGEFNLSNLLGVLAELCLQGFDFKNALSALSHTVAAPGRMQRMGSITTPQIIIDFAHTPDALENALKSARLHCTRRLWCVFGCGGDRDKDKRAKMGNIAASLADRVVITNDNPRTEHPLKIIEDIMQGLNVEYSEKIIVEENREAAIAYAINNALAVDTIMIAGKGHENYQIIGNKKYPFSDAECVNALLREDKNEAVRNR